MPTTLDIGRSVKLTSDGITIIDYRPNRATRTLTEKLPANTQGQCSTTAAAVPFPAAVTSLDTLIIINLDAAIAIEFGVQENAVFRKVITVPAGQDRMIEGLSCTAAQLFVRSASGTPKYAIIGSQA